MEHDIRPKKKKTFVSGHLPHGLKPPRIKIFMKKKKPPASEPSEWKGFFWIRSMLEVIYLCSSNHMEEKHIFNMVLVIVLEVC